MHNSHQFLVLARIALKDNDKTRRLNALRQIAAIDDPCVDRLLSRVSRQDPSPEVRELAQQLQAAWDCQHCGGHNIAQSECAYCGTPRQEQWSAPKDLVAPPANTTSEKTFLFYPENQAFIEGRRRRIHGNDGVGCFFILFMIPFALMGIFVIALTVWEFNVYTTLQNEGVITDGRVLSRRFDPASDSDDSDTWFVAFTYAAEGREYTHEQSVSEAFYNRAEQGGRIEVRYAASDPSLARLEGTTSTSSFTFLGVFSILWNVVSWGVLGAAIVSRRKQTYLVRKGRILKGRVIECMGETDSDGDYYVKVEFDFQPEDGGPALQTHKRLMLNHAKGRRLPLYGTPVAVLYANRRNFELL